MEMNNIKVRLNNSYPEIVGANDNPQTVAIIKDLLSAREGEITGIMTYIYQSQLANMTDSEISDVLEEIAVVEMEHMELLMNAICAFGGDPKYENSRGQQFTTTYVNYSTKLKDMLDANIMAEQRAIDNYSKAINMVSNNSLKDLFARIIEDEEIHLKIFKNLKNTVKFLSI